jgi:hypothetical protein
MAHGPAIKKKFPLSVNFSLGISNIYIKIFLQKYHFSTDKLKAWSSIN